MRISTYTDVRLSCSWLLADRDLEMLLRNGPEQASSPDIRRHPGVSGAGPTRGASASCVSVQLYMQRTISVESYLLMLQRQTVEIGCPASASQGDIGQADQHLGHLLRKRAPPSNRQQRRRLPLASSGRKRAKDDGAAACHSALHAWTGVFAPEASTLGAKCCTPESNTSEIILDSQLYVPMDFQWHFRRNYIVQCYVPKDCHSSNGCFLESPMACQWHFRRDVHVY